MTTLLVDADDTLWENIVVFNRVNQLYVDWLLPGQSLSEMQPKLDALQVECIAQFGYGRETFEKSLVAGVERFADRTATNADRERISELVQPLQWHTIELREGVVETLEVLAQRARLILVTKGDHNEQQVKLDRSGLAHFFVAVEILDTKTPEEYRRIVHEHNLDPVTTWMIGNSPKSDISPALEVGLGAVFIPHTETWSHEHAEVDDHPRLVHLTHFRDLLSTF